MSRQHDLVSVAKLRPRILRRLYLAWLALVGGWTFHGQTLDPDGSYKVWDEDKGLLVFQMPWYEGREIRNRREKELAGWIDENKILSTQIQMLENEILDLDAEIESLTREINDLKAKNSRAD